MINSKKKNILPFEEIRIKDISFCYNDNEEDSIQY